MLVAEGGSRSSESNFDVDACDRFIVEFGTPGILKSMFSSSVARLNSLSALTDAMSRFSSGTKCSFTMCVLELFGSTGCPVPSVSMLDTNVHQTISQVSPIYPKNQVLCANDFHRSPWERDVFPLSTKTRSVSQVSLIDHRLVWVWIGLVWRV